MGRFKTEADRTTKRSYQARITNLEKQVTLLTTTVAQILREAMTIPAPAVPAAEGAATPEVVDGR